MKKNNKNNGTIARVVKAHCLKEGITLEQLSARIGKSPGSLSSIINGNPTISNLKEVLNELNLNLSITTDKYIINI